MRPDTDMSALIDGIYDAAVDGNQWTTALNKLARAARADASSIVVQDRVSGTFWNAAVGSQALMIQAYDSWAGLNPLWLPTLTAPAGAVLVDPVVATREAYERSRDLSATYAHSSACAALSLISVAAVKVLRDPVVSGVVTLARGRFTAPFEHDDVTFLLHLAPHLQRAIEMNRRVAKLEDERAGLLDALERSSQGILLLDGNARILFANGTAQMILRQGDGLRAAPDGLHAGRETAALRRLVAQGDREMDGESGGFVTIKRPSPRRPLLVSVVPLRRATSWLASQAPRMLAFIADPDTLPVLPTEQIRGLYGLTAAEAEVALAVLDGEGVGAIADGLGISVATARTHLHRIFEKTGTKRQAELVRLILNSRLMIKSSECDQPPRGARV